MFASGFRFSVLDFLKLSNRNEELNEEQMMKIHNRFRFWRAVMYFLFTLAGVLAVLFPSQLVKDQVGTLVVTLWSLGLVVSSVGSMLGAITDRWLGEYTFLPLLFSVLFLFAISSILGVEPGNSRSYPLLAYGLIVLGLASGLVARWQDVKDSKTASKKEPNTPQE